MTLQFSIYIISRKNIFTSCNIKGVKPPKSIKVSLYRRKMKPLILPRRVDIESPHCPDTWELDGITIFNKNPLKKI
jgi:hypothetical protein